MTEEELRTLEMQADLVERQYSGLIAHGMRRLIAEVRRLQAIDHSRGIRFDLDGNPYLAIRDQMR